MLLHEAGKKRPRIQWNEPSLFFVLIWIFPSLALFSHFPRREVKKLPFISPGMK